MTCLLYTSMLICEEAWKALSSPSMSEYLKYMYKTVRKYFGEAIVVTQEVDDKMCIRDRLVAGYLHYRLGCPLAVIDCDFPQYSLYELSLIHI